MTEHKLQKLIEACRKAAEGQYALDHREHKRNRKETAS